MHRRLAEQPHEALRQRRARQADLPAKRLQAPRLGHPPVQQGEAAADEGIAQPGEPAGVPGGMLSRWVRTASTKISSDNRAITVSEPGRPSAICSAAKRSVLSIHDERPRRKSRVSIGGSAAISGLPCPGS